MEEYNSIVNDDDTVYIFGDFSLNKIDMLNCYCDRLNGNKIFVLGNHDSWKIKKWLEERDVKCFSECNIDGFLCTHEHVKEVCLGNVYCKYSWSYSQNTSK